MHSQIANPSGDGASTTAARPYRNSKPNRGIDTKQAEHTRENGNNESIVNATLSTQGRLAMTGIKKSCHESFLAIGKAFLHDTLKLPADMSSQCFVADLLLVVGVICRGQCLPGYWLVPRFAVSPNFVCEESILLWRPVYVVAS